MRHRLKRVGIGESLEKVSTQSFSLSVMPIPDFAGFLTTRRAGTLVVALRRNGASELPRAGSAASVGLFPPLYLIKKQSVSRERPT